MSNCKPRQQPREILADQLARLGAEQTTEAGVRRQQRADAVDGDDAVAGGVHDRGQMHGAVVRARACGDYLGEQRSNLPAQQPGGRADQADHQQQQHVQALAQIAVERVERRRQRDHQRCAGDGAVRGEEAGAAGLRAQGHAALAAEREIQCAGAASRVACDGQGRQRRRGQSQTLHRVRAECLTDGGVEFTGRPVGQQGGVQARQRELHSDEAAAAGGIGGRRPLDHDMSFVADLDAGLIVQAHDGAGRRAERARLQQQLAVGVSQVQRLQAAAQRQPMLGPVLQALAQLERR